MPIRIADAITVRHMTIVGWPAHRTRWPPTIVSVTWVGEAAGARTQYLEVLDSRARGWTLPVNALTARRFRSDNAVRHVSTWSAYQLSLGFEFGGK